MSLPGRPVDPFRDLDARILDGTFVAVVSHDGENHVPSADSVLETPTT